LPAEPYQVLDAAPVDEARELLTRCCGSRRWVEGMLARRPFGSPRALGAAAEEVWAALDRDDYLEAFAQHPRIGASEGSRWSRQEQARVEEADERTVEALRAANVAYADNFGFIFIVCATGKSAEQILALLEARLANDAGTELQNAAAEQAKITGLRLEKLGR
jgi:OHCU decarboxylase